MIRTRVWTVVVLVVLAGGASSLERPASAAPGVVPVAPEVVIRKTIEEAFDVLRNKTLAGKEKRGERIAELRRIADRTFDWGEMAKSSLGVHWRGLEADRRTRFTEVFKSILAAQYMDDIDRFQGTETITIDGTKVEVDGALVRSTLVTASRDRVPLDYRMRLIQGEWRVVDLSIEGVSLVNHFRKTFSSALANISIDELIERLKRQLPQALKPSGT